MFIIVLLQGAHWVCSSQNESIIISYRYSPMAVKCCDELMQACNVLLPITET